MAWLVSGLIHAGLAQAQAKRFAPWVALALFFALLGLSVVIFRLWDFQDDKEAITVDRNAARAEFQERQINAERAAGAAKVERDRAAAAKQDKLEDKIDDARAHGGTAADDVWNNGLWD
ncbi:hypothetical protein [Novosphingobium sp. ST904]|uniref:hypothetical protein n=1 Tax=Novosphingobium sp. ST904 TaxID=1684385 RepID=UPI0006C8C511|nr:hypothetical protein [Novosphingobium sp. ST904]KPH59198.1 hypothetical protein ADT71_23955 [Novosphingobium sp. ST904]TCM37713.1 hypothetical protein EDF59_110109 [Novosphingobium sp. ST904]